MPPLHPEDVRYWAGWAIAGTVALAVEAWLLRRVVVRPILAVLQPTPGVRQAHPWRPPYEGQLWSPRMGLEGEPRCLVTWVRGGVTCFCTYPRGMVHEKHRDGFMEAEGPSALSHASCDVSHTLWGYRKNGYDGETVRCTLEVGHEARGQVEHWDGARSMRF